MGLQIWLPLNGDAENQGLMDISPKAVGSGTWENGKIGKCYNGTGNGYINLNASITMNGAFSIALWIKVNSFNGAWLRVFGFQKNTNEYLGMCYSNTNTIGFHIYDSVNGTRTGLYDAYRYTPVVGEWSHITLVFDGVKTMRWYKDGNLLHTDTNVKSFAGDTYTQCAICSIGDGKSKADCSVNDFRLYDTALSPLEIKHIAQGLILHYPLSMPGGENLVPCGGTYTKNSPRTTTSAKVDGNVWIPNSAFEGTPSTTYTISVQCDGTLSDRHGAQSSLTPQDKPWGFWLYISNVDTTKSWQTGSYDTPVFLCSINHNYRKIGNTHVWTYTLSSTQKYISLRTNSYSDGTTNVTVNWWNIKVEKGDTFTPWIPSTSSELYTALGFDDGIEYDVSGFCNNGTKHGAITYDADTPRYETSAVFNGIDSYIKMPTMTLDMGNVTFSVWAKWDAFNTWSRTWDFGVSTNGADYVLCLTNQNSTGNIMLAGRGPGGTPVLNTEIATVNAGEYNHFVIVMSDSICNAYVNGVLSKTWSIGGGNPGIITLNNCFLGKSNWSTDKLFSGGLSDFRIYATALSASDVQALYNTPINLSSNGTITTQGEYVEV